MLDMTLIAKEERCNEQRQSSHGGQAKMGRGQSETRSVPTWSLSPTFQGSPRTISIQVYIFGGKSAFFRWDKLGMLIVLD